MSAINTSIGRIIPGKTYVRAGKHDTHLIREGYLKPGEKVLVLNATLTTIRWKCPITSKRTNLTGYWNTSINNFEIANTNKILKYLSNPA